MLTYSKAPAKPWSDSSFEETLRNLYTDIMQGGNFQGKDFSLTSF